MIYTIHVTIYTIHVPINQAMGLKVWIYTHTSIYTTTTIILRHMIYFTHEPFNQAKIYKYTDYILNIVYIIYIYIIYNTLYILYIHYVLHIIYITLR